MTSPSHFLRHRSGRETTAVSIGLFLLSLCGVAAVFVRFDDHREATAESETYTFVQPALEASPAIRTWHHVDDFPVAIAQMESVFWEPDDTSSLRSWLQNSARLKTAAVLEIGCGTGLVSIECALRGARSVVATDINSAAVVNATYNAERCGVSQRMTVRQVDAAHAGPFAVVAADEKFDLIISNPPWEDAPVDSPAAYALYDPGFQLLDGILTESREHLRPSGRLLLAYGAKRAIDRIQTLSPRLGWRVVIHDTRELDSLPEVFLPGMLLELQAVDAQE